jgi:RHH-type transcriptional regulator, proline utilization regulon repressor / proline dehydrogenase / delta 1-pyrroline-5-carboxylate dehydrogenase
MTADASRGPMRRLLRAPEAECVAALLDAAQVDPPRAAAARQLAQQLTVSLRQRRARGSGVDALMHEFSLSSQEGVALMCLAEALLRIPDTATADALIRDKLAAGDWRSHIGRGRSLFVNAAAWGLMVSGELVATHSEEGLGAALGRLVARGGEPLIRRGVDLAMRMLGQQFVLGSTIEEALQRARVCEARGYRYSFDMLGEAALTAEDAERYLGDYERAIEAIGQAGAGRGVHDGPGISVKLSALHPRYAYSQRARVLAELAPRLAHLCLAARDRGIGLNIDAEESEVLELSVDLLEGLAAMRQLSDWPGLGFVIQAYQKRAPVLIDYVADLAKQHRRRLMVRLVKGAYWDSEIKRAQVEGQGDFPVFTHKAHTDVCYLACAERLLSFADRLYPQFATHNALTLATVQQMCQRARVADWEFQCLHGMGEALYDELVRPDQQSVRCRIYAPVGSHDTLLPYLVRRLLENGANTSFVSQVADPRLDLAQLLSDPVVRAQTTGGAPHPRIARPPELYGTARANSRGLDLNDEPTLGSIRSGFDAAARRSWQAGEPAGPASDVTSPANRSRRVGTVIEASPGQLERLLAVAHQAAPQWAQVAAPSRAALLRAAADRLEDERLSLMWLAVHEAGRTIGNALAEVREAADFCRYYATQLEAGPPLPGEALGPVAAISPWNFPLAIFTGQIAAALGAGNVVIAKPAPQTPLIAAQAVRLLHEAGIPQQALQLAPGGAQVGAQLVRDARMRGVLFTGSTRAAQQIDRDLAMRAGGQAARGQPVLVAETGGQNAMIVDSSALPEQVVRDALTSAFDSAGQRCSALRLLCLQEDVAPRIMPMLLGAAAELRVGDPERLDTDVGPLIDAPAAAAIQQHLDRMQQRHRIERVPLSPAQLSEVAQGTFLAPAIVEIDSVDELQHEVFGPVLHVLKYRRDRLGDLLDAINSTGYALTFGVHSRVDETIGFVSERIRAGNIYVNRNMIGAVVGVQPFGGEGLSGTGPKAGGPWMMQRLRTGTDARALAPVGLTSRDPPPSELAELAAWATGKGHGELLRACDRYRELTPVGCRHDLPGPTGESNVLDYRPRGRVLCRSGDPAGCLLQIAAVVATSNRALLEESPWARALVRDLPAAIAGRIDWTDRVESAAFELALTDRESDCAALRRQLAQRDGARVRVLHGGPEYGLQWMVAERVVSTNTTAAGGNASLLTLD